MVKDSYQEMLSRDQIRSNPSLSELEQERLLTDIQVQESKQSSFKTIFSLTNSMIGSSTLIFPLVFQDSGIVISLLTMILICLISYKSSSLLFLHSKKSEIDLQDSIKRIMGYRFYLSYIVASICLMFFSGIVYFLFACNTVYDFIKLICLNQGIHLPQKNQMVYDQFSYQYLGILMIGLNFLVFLAKDLKLFIKMGVVGVIALISYIVYLLVMALQNISRPDFEASSINLFSTKISTSLGVFSTSFFIQSILMPIFKNNKNPKNNQRDLLIGYVNVYLIYSLMGVFGAIAIAGKQVSNNPQTVLDYFINNTLTALPLLLVSVQLQIGFPLIWYCTYSLIINLIYSRASHLPNNPWLKVISNTLYLGVCLILQQFNVNITLIISLIGAICGWWLIYIIPFGLHLQCLYKCENIVINMNFGSLETPINSDNEAVPNKNKTSIDYQLIDQHLLETRTRCKSGHIQLYKKFNKKVRLVSYLVLVLVGFTILIMKILESFKVIA